MALAGTLIEDPGVTVAVGQAKPSIRAGKGFTATEQGKEAGVECALSLAVIVTG